MADIKINPGFACKVGDIFEYPETGEYEKLRGERIMVLETGKGRNPDHMYIRALCFRPDVENDSFHFSCNDRYMDKILEHWRFVGHMDISLLIGGKESNDPDYKMMLTAYSLVNASNLRHMLAAKESENVDLKNENAFLTHRLREAEAQYKKEKNDAKIEKAINCRGDAIRKDIKCINETLTSVFDGFYEKGKELKEENEKLQKENEGLRHKLREAEAQYKKEKNECDNVEEGKETLDKINSALSALIGYDDLVLRVKVNGDQVKRIKNGEDTVEFETVDKNIRELQKENEGLKEEIDILKKKIEQRERDIATWKKGWYDCLDSFNYYLKG